MSCQRNDFRLWSLMIWSMDSSTELLQIALLYETLDISLTDVKLAVFGQVDGSGGVCERRESSSIHLSEIKLTHIPSGFHQHLSALGRQ